MEDDLDLTEATESSITFFVPDSQIDDEENSKQGLDLVTALLALKPEPLSNSGAAHTDIRRSRFSVDTTMSENKARAYLGYSSTNESEVEEQAIQLASDSVSDVSDGQNQKNGNVTVIERGLTAHGTMKEEEKTAVSTPAQKIASLQFSGQPLMVPETIDSFDEVAPSPNAYGNVPTIIPDSPCMDDKDDSESEEEVTFQPLMPTVDPDLCLTAQTSATLSESRAESQSFHLKLSPSQPDAEYALVTVDTEEDVTEEGAVSSKAAPGKSSLKLGQDSHHTVQATANSELSLQLEKADVPAEEMTNLDDSEESISVFRRVKSGNTTPKRRVFLDDSDEFLPMVKGSIVASKSDQTLPRKQLEQLFTSPNTSSSKKSHGKCYGTIFDLDNSEHHTSRKKFEKTESRTSTNSGKVKSRQKATSKIDLTISPKEKAGRSSHTTAMTEGEVQKDPVSPEYIDVDLTLSYDYMAGKTLPSDPALEVNQVDRSSKEREHNSPDELVEPSQKYSQQAHKNRESSSHQGQEFDSLLEPSNQTAANRKEDGSFLISKVIHSQNIISEQTKETDHSHSKTVLPPVTKASISLVKREKRSYTSQDPEAPKSAVYPPEMKDKGDGCSAEVNVEGDVHNSETTSVTSNTANNSVAAGNLPATSLKEVTFSDATTLRESRSVDPYSYHGSHSQTCESVSYLPQSDRNRASVTGRRIHAVKTVRKVLRKRIPPKLDDNKSSSTEDVSKTKNNQNPPKTKGNILRRRNQQRKSLQTKQQKHVLNQQQQTHPEMFTTEQHTVFTALQKKAAFNKPLDPPPARAGPSSHAFVESRDNETNQQNKEGPTKSKKSATVSFSGFDQAQAPDMREFDGSEQEVERTRVQRIMNVVVTTSERTIIEVFNTKGEITRRIESSKVVETTTMEPKVMSEQMKVREITHQLSPSRSASTMTSGDLGDISSLSLSRTHSSGSKGSNPSLESVQQSLDLPTPAQRQHLLEGKNKEKVQQISEGQQDPDMSASSKVMGALLKADQKRLSSASSNTGQDLFSSPNQSIIDRADSQIGKVISSSNSTPSSHSMTSPNAAVYSNKEQDDQSKTKPIDSNQTHSNNNQARASREKSKSKASPEKSKSEGIISPIAEQKEGMKSQGAKTDVHSGSENRRSDRSKSEKLSSEVRSRKRKLSDHDTSNVKQAQQKRLASAEKRKDNSEGSPDIQSTGFSIQGAPPSASGESVKDPVLNASSSKSSTGTSVSPQISLQGTATKLQAQMIILKDYKSKVMTGAKVMGKWKDGFYYPGVLSKVDQSNKKYMVKFDDGSQRAVKMGEIILAAELPVGQSVMVMARDDFYEPGMILGHSESRDEENMVKLIYHVARDDGVTQMCEKQSLILSEDQAACLLSDEEMRIGPDAHLPLTSKPADISLENLVEGKRHPKSMKASSNNEDQPSTSGLQSTSAAVASAAISTADGEMSHSGRKRKIGPVATSTPTPKQSHRETPDKGTPVSKKPSTNVLGSVVSSPLPPSRSPRKARIGLFAESITTKKSRLFEGMVFVLTHIEKSPQYRAQERMLLEGSSLEASSDDGGTDLDTVTSSFVKEQLQAVIEKGGGQVISSFDDAHIQTAKHCYLVAAEHQRTVKYLEALAAGITIVSHQWILDSVAHNKLLGLKAYILPAGISLERKKLIEGSKGCIGLSKQTVMVVSSNKEFVEAWTSIMKKARCQIVTRFPSRASKNDPGLDVVVSDSTCPASIVRRCRQLEVLLVSSEWVAQCLINGHLVDASGHEKYRYNFMEKS